MNVNLCVSLWASVCVGGVFCVCMFVCLYMSMCTCVVGVCVCVSVCRVRELI